MLVALVIIAGVLWSYHPGSPLLPLHNIHRVVANKPALITAPQATAPQKKLPEPKKKVLNLVLPHEPLMNYSATLPDSQHDLRDLFKPEEQKESTVRVGGHLILDDKPPPPNAAVWDQVKGAEVGITIKTP